MFGELVGKDYAGIIVRRHLYPGGGMELYAVIPGIGYKALHAFAREEYSVPSPPGSLFNDDVVPGEKSRNSRNRKFCLFNPIRSRVDRVVVRSPEVGFFNHRPVEYSLRQIAIVKHRPRQVAFRKIDLLYLCIPEYGLFDLCPEERRVIELAAPERKGKSEFITGIETESKHFALVELNVAKGSLAQCGQTQIAAVEDAVDEPEFREVVAGKITMVENAFFVFTLRQRFPREVFFVVGRVVLVWFLHFSVHPATVVD